MIPACTTIFLLGLAFAVILGASMMRRKQETRAVDLLAAIASERGWRMDSTYSLSGAAGRGSLNVLLTTERRGSGKNRRTVSVTRYHLRPPAALRMGLKVHAQSALFGDFAEAVGLVSDIRIGRADVDDAVRIAAADPQHAAAVLGEEPVAQAILVARLLNRFYLADDVAFAQHDGWVADRATFEQYVGPLVRTIDAITEARMRHRAAWEHEVDRVWGSVAGSEGLTYTAAHSALSTEWNGVTTSLAVGVKNAGLTMHAEIRVPQPLANGLDVRVTGTLDAVGKVFGAQDLTLGVPGIDERFTIKATNESAARSLLLSVAADLTLVTEAFPDLRITDAGLSAARDGLVLDAHAIAALMRALARIAQALAGSAGGSIGAFR